MRTSAFYTDHYELTMLDAALGAGRADDPVVFEVFTRSLPAGRRYGVFAGLERVVEHLDRFTFGPDELEWLARRRIVSDRALEWLADYRFRGDIDSYPEGEIYAAGSPVFTVSGTFAESVILETVVLSILNHDASVAAAASVISAAAGDRPVIEMGSRRTDPEAAVAAARAAYIGGLASTSNLEAGRRYGVPTAGTAAHAFVLLFPHEGAAFEAQLSALGESTTLLVDTYDTEGGIRAAFEAAGPALGAVRIDSGDLGVEALRARQQLDRLGAGQTRVVVTGDLDERAIRALSGTPVDAYGAGTSVVMGGDRPTAGLVYKLVEVAGRPVEKRSPGKATVGGRKWARRDSSNATDILTGKPLAMDGRAMDGRPLQARVVESGASRLEPDLEEARRRHRRSVELLGERNLAVRYQG